MKKRTVHAVCFSATGTNKTSVCAIAEGFGGADEVIDVTRFDSVSREYTYTEQDLLIIGAPVYGGRVYAGAIKRFSHFHGTNTPAIVTVTYGNRHYDDALLELCECMKAQGFLPIAAAALIGEHTYGRIQLGRPDENDKRQDIEFAKQVAAKLVLEDGVKKEVVVPGNHPYREGGNGGGFRPLTSDSCIGCGRCIAECPEGAIAEDGKTIDDEKCIACFRCIRICPVHAKNMDTPQYKEFAKDFSKKLAKRRENEYFI